jgi:hypothetical protein
MAFKSVSKSAKKETVDHKLLARDALVNSFFGFGHGLPTDRSASAGDSIFSGRDPKNTVGKMSDEKVATLNHQLDGTKTSRTNRMLHRTIPKINRVLADVLQESRRLNLGAPLE